MNRTLNEEQIALLSAKLGNLDSASVLSPSAFQRSPVHVVYGGANLFKAETPAKLGKIALKSLAAYAPDFTEFARAMWLTNADTLPIYEDSIRDLQNQLENDEKKVQSENYAAWFAWTIYNRTIEKLKREAVEDFRIDFEDGYGFRTDEEEDSHALSASDELAKFFLENSITAFCGFRIKSFQKETFKRAVRTLDLFITNLLEKTGGKLPPNFVVTLPKIRFKEEVEILAELLNEFEAKNVLEKGAIKIEIMVETPESIVNEKGEIALKSLVKAGAGRVTSAHFGAYDYTASFGISGAYQHLQHESCNFARQMMQLALAPLNIRLSDSVTTEMPVPVYKGESLTRTQLAENKAAVHKAWRTHFKNVTNSLINGFYQSWDLHPAQLAARYAAVYAFFLESANGQAKRLKGFIGKATQANLTGNTFDDAASAQGLLNFFIRALNCGALTEEEVLTLTNLNNQQLQTNSFIKIMKSVNVS